MSSGLGNVQSEKAQDFTSLPMEVDYLQFINEWWERPDQVQTSQVQEKQEVICLF